MGALLMYHGVGDIPASHGEPGYTLAATRFARQLDLLARAPLTVLSLERCLDSGGGGRHAVVLSFDDGEASVAEQALPLLTDRGMVGTVYMTSGWVGQPGYLSVEQLRALHTAGWTIGAHGVTHRYLSSLDNDELDRELRDSRQSLEAIINAPVEHMALPGGRADHRIQAAARRAGYRSLATSTPGRLTRATPLLDLPRLAILASTPESAFQGLVQGRLPIYLKAMARALALDSAKRVLGDQRYDRLRAEALRRLGW